MSAKIDDKDRRILSALKEKADSSTRKIASQVKLPITTVHHRIKRMVKDGVIRRFTVDVDHAKLDQGFLAYVLIFADLAALKKNKESQYDLARKLRKLENVVRVDIISGAADLIAVVRAKGVEEYNQLLLGKLQIIEGVEKTQSLIALHSPEG